MITFSFIVSSFVSFHGIFEGMRNFILRLAQIGKSKHCQITTIWSPFESRLTSNCNLFLGCKDVVHFLFWNSRECGDTNHLQLARVDYAASFGHFSDKFVVACRNKCDERVYLSTESFGTSQPWWKQSVPD